MSYCAHFDLAVDPFPSAPATVPFFRSAAHDEAVSALCYAVATRRGFAALVAGPGLGKTTVLECAAERLRGDGHAVVFLPIFFRAESPIEMICDRLGLAVSAGRHCEALEDLLSANAAKGRSLVLIIDEAQALNLEQIEAVRLIAGLRAGVGGSPQILLAGQPELRELLSQPACEQFRQRIGVTAALWPLSTVESRDYIGHRISQAGGGPDLFNARGIDTIAAASGGNPRKIHVLCSSALVEACGAGKRTVGNPEVVSALRDWNLLSPQTERASSKQERSFMRVRVEGSRGPIATNQVATYLITASVVAIALITSVEAAFHGDTAAFVRPLLQFVSGE